MPRPIVRLMTATALCAATPLFAQQQPDVAFQLDRIVLGTGTPRVALDTPQAVTVLDREDIERQQAATPAELLNEIPGVQAIGSGRAAGISFNIRGIGELSSSDESRIIVTIDGAPKFHEQYRVGSFFGEPELYRRIEVLRGPASSTLVGAGALGGAIAFETKDAADFLTGDANHALHFRLGASSNGEGGVGTLTYAGPASERIEFLASLTYRRAAEYDDGDGNSIDGSDFDALSGLIKSTFRIDDAQTLRLSYAAYDSDLDDTSYSATGTLPLGDIDRKVTDQTVTLGYANTAPDTALVDLDVTLFYSDTTVEQSDASAPIPSPLFLDSEYAYRTVGVKIQNTSTLELGGGETFLTYGLQASRQERIAETGAGGIGFHPEGVDRRIGLFAQAEMTFGGLTLVPGLRLDRFDLSPDADIAGARDETTTAVSPKLAALYAFNGTWSAFGSITQTQRAPTIDELFSSEAIDGIVPALTLDPEDSEAVELGFAYARDGLFAPGDQLAVKVTGFNYDIDGLIARPPTAERLPGTPYYEQIGSARLRGVEIEGAYEAERAYARLAYTYVDGEDRDTGETLSSVPAENLVLTLGGRNGARTLDYGWQGTLVDTITDPADTRFGGYAVHDIYASYTPDSGAPNGWQLRAGIDNLLDRDYRNSLAGDDGPGRTFKVTFTRGLQW